MSVMAAGVGAFHRFDDGEVSGTSGLRDGSGRAHPDHLVDGFRPPAVPLVVMDPYQSIWLMGDQLTEDFARHWSGAVMALMGMIRVDGVPYRWMGPDASKGGVDVPAMQQLSVRVAPTQTHFTFAAGGVQLKVRFTSPLLFDDLSIWSQPSTFLNLEASSADGRAHRVQLYYDSTAEVAVAEPLEPVVWADVSEAAGPELVAMRVGTEAQKVFGRKGDAVKINWGFAYVSTARAPGGGGGGGLNHTAAEAKAARGAFVGNTAMPPFDRDMPRPCADRWPVLALTWDLGEEVAAHGAPVTRSLVYSYDDVGAMEFFGEPQAALWRRSTRAGDDAAIAMLRRSHARQPELEARCDRLDAAIVGAAAAHRGDKYATLTALAYRQCFGAMKVVWDARRNRTVLYMKEISSDGDVSTVDVVFPASPQLLFFSPATLRLTLLPVLEYANNRTDVPYGLPWAPHHLGEWPVCDERPDQQEQMPMEETGNMLMMIAAVVQGEGDDSWLAEGDFWPLLSSWAEYLAASLPDPGDQLCTDDFEGKSPHNANLAVKGVVGLAAYASLIQQRNATASDHYMRLARGFAGDWQRLANDSSHYRMQYNLPDSWSLKYNLLFQRLLDLPELFPQAVFDTEETFYQTKMNTFGVPLDNRAAFTKTDWSAFIAAMGSAEQFQAIFDAIYKFADETPDRVPFTDWYETDTGRLKGFRARPVIGGLFAGMLV